VTWRIVILVPLLQLLNKVKKTGIAESTDQAAVQGTVSHQLLCMKLQSDFTSKLKDGPKSKRLRNDMKYKSKYY
jgi:hypothetical protein